MLCKIASLSLLCDLDRLDFRALFQKLGRNSHSFNVTRALPQTVESFSQFFGICG